MKEWQHIDDRHVDKKRVVPCQPIGPKVSYCQENTEAGRSPWHLIPATDRRFARIKTFEVLRSCLEGALAERGIEVPRERDTDFEDDNGNEEE